MAFSVRITGLRSIYDPPEIMDKPAFEIEPSWWPRDALKNDRRFVKTRDLGSYDDYTAQLSLAEVRELFEKYWPEEGSIYGGSEPVLKSIAEFEKALASGEYKAFRVCVFEWESGY